ncbi:MAG TPA: pilus assembly protein PilM [Clostridia bacterium]|nr:pilus assembly protein PilM [Clostridia bacterium]
MLLSIDVGSVSLYAVQGSCSAGAVSIDRAGEIALPEVTIEDGMIKNHASFIMTVNKLLTLCRFTARNTVFTITSSSVLSRRLELPASTPRELNMMVNNEMIQVVNDSSDFVYEYSIIGPEHASKQKTIPVWAYALPRDCVDQYYSVFNGIRLKPKALDIHPNSAEKLFVNSSVNGNEIGQKSILFADIRQNDVEIHLISDGQRAFSRTSPVSSSTFEAILNNSGLVPENVSMFDSLDITSDKFRGNSILNDAAHQYINQICEELQKMVQFQLRRNSTNPVAGVYIYGNMSGIRGLTEGMSSLLGIHVEKVEAVSKVKAGNLEIAKYINAIGALIRL